MILHPDTASYRIGHMIPLLLIPAYNCHHVGISAVYPKQRLIILYILFKMLLQKDIGYQPALNDRNYRFQLFLDQQLPFPLFLFPVNDPHSFFQDSQDPLSLHGLRNIFKNPK